MVVVVVVVVVVMIEGEGPWRDVLSSYSSYDGIEVIEEEDLADREDQLNNLYGNSLLLELSLLVHEISEGRRLL